jgi:hypothetical protein
MNRVEALRTALRVLTSICERGEPDIADVSELRAYAPDLITCDTDEIAREVIERTMSTKSVNSVRRDPGEGFFRRHA